MNTDDRANLREYLTTFAEWVFQQTYPEAAARQAALRAGAREKERGRIAHRLILESICKSSDFLSVLRRSTRPDEWRVVYPHGQDAPTYVASNLPVDGKAVRCRPDLVLKHRGTGALVIVDYKTTRTFTGNVRKRDGALRVFDAGGYPNNTAQLWCYSQIDEFRERWPLLVLQFRDAETLGHKETITWRSSDRQFEESRDWFRRYGGRIVSSPST